MSEQYNIKPREVYCPQCLATAVTDAPNPQCPTCQVSMITITFSTLTGKAVVTERGKWTLNS